MAHALTGEEFEKIRDEFIEMDEDKNGFVMLETLISRETNEHAEASMNLFISLLDIQDKGFVTFTDFLEGKALMQYGKKPTKYQLRRFFKVYDVDGDGFILLIVHST